MFNRHFICFHLDVSSTLGVRGVPAVIHGCTLTFLVMVCVKRIRPRPWAGCQCSKTVHGQLSWCCSKRKTVCVGDEFVHISRIASRQSQQVCGVLQPSFINLHCRCWFCVLMCFVTDPGLSMMSAVTECREVTAQLSAKFTHRLHAHLTHTFQKMVSQTPEL